MLKKLREWFMVAAWLRASKDDCDEPEDDDLFFLELSCDESGKSNVFLIEGGRDESGNVDLFLVDMLITIWALVSLWWFAGQVNGFHVDLSCFFAPLMTSLLSIVIMSSVTIADVSVVVSWLAHDTLDKLKNA